MHKTTLNSCLIKALKRHVLPGFSIDLNFQDVMTSKLKKFGRQCTKFGSHAVCLQENWSKNEHISPIAK